MKKMFLLKIFKLIALLLLTSCSEEITSTNEEDLLPDPKDPPVINEIISPQTIVIAGYDELVIKGSNFSDDPEQIGLYFNEVRAEILTASTSELRIKAPNVAGDSIVVKMWIKDSDKYSNEIIYQMEFAAVQYYSFKKGVEPYAIAMDVYNNLFVSLTENDFGEGVKKITPAGILEDYANKGGETFYTGLKVGPDSILLAARKVFALFEIPANSGSIPVDPATWFIYSGHSSFKFADLDYDKNLNVWTVGDNEGIVRVKSIDKTAKQFDFTGNLRSVRIYSDNGIDYIYVAGTVDSLESVWRAEIISEDSLGSFTNYFDLSSVAGYENSIIYAITFSHDGYMYVGTDGYADTDLQNNYTDPILEIIPGGGMASVFYPGLLPSDVRYFTWGIDNYLYYTKGKKGDPNNYDTIYRINMRNTGSPYYGRGDL